MCIVRKLPTIELLIKPRGSSAAPLTRLSSKSSWLWYFPKSASSSASCVDTGSHNWFSQSVGLIGYVLGTYHVWCYIDLKSLNVVLGMTSHWSWQSSGCRLSQKSMTVHPLLLLASLTDKQLITAEYMKVCTWKHETCAGRCCPVVSVTF